MSFKKPLTLDVIKPYSVIELLWRQKKLHKHKVRDPNSVACMPYIFNTSLKCIITIILEIRSDSSIFQNDLIHRVTLGNLIFHSYKNLQISSTNEYGWISLFTVSTKYVWTRSNVWWKLMSVNWNWGLMSLHNRISP